jgi:anti-anti-sigma factor
MTSSSTPPAGNGGATFSISRAEHDDEIVVALTGDFDIAAVAPFADATSDIPAGSRVLLDLREVAFMDSSGVRALMNLDVRARADGFQLAMAGPQPRVRRVLDLCGFEDRIPIRDDVGR